MNPDIIFLLGTLVMLGAIPAAVGSFSSSDGTMKPVIACIAVGGGMIVLAMIQNPGGYEFADLPRIVKELF